MLKTTIIMRPEEGKPQFEANELMRISLFKREDGKFEVCFMSRGPKQPMREAVTVAANQLGMKCIPEEMFSFQSFPFES